ncbi:MAG: cell division protein FtsA [Gemmatimonadota bacterium]|nr:cell division protein FtsA [Gemmatimonadota bacterium]MDE2985295.1 cell division protein FtsA [Gemmatimonadota bacterium]
MKSILVTGLDIGSTCTRVVIGECVREFQRPEVRVLGVGRAPTNGVRKDQVTDLEAATDTVRRALQEAELMAGMRVDRVYVGVSGEHVDANRSVGVVAVGAAEIVSRDVKRVHAVARAVPVVRDRELLHAIPQNYFVDNQGGIKDPVGMSGTRLETELYLVTGCSAVVGNIVRAVEKAGYRVQHAVLEPIAASRAVLAEDERELGVAMLDMGGATTGLSVHYEGRIRHLEVLPFGGNAITSDLIRGLAVPFAEARRIKELHGAAHARGLDPDELVELPRTNGSRREVSRGLVAGLIEERMQNMFQRVRRRIQDVLPQATLGAGVVITGGVAVTPGILAVAKRSLRAPVRVGVPREGLSGLMDVVDGPGYATAAGLALHGADCFMDTGGGVSTVASGVVTRMGTWLREFF